MTSFVHGWCVIVPLLILAVLWLWVALAEEPEQDERERPLWDDVWDGNVEVDDE